MTAIIPCGSISSYPCPPAFGADELGKAAAICYSHQQISVMLLNPPPRIPQFQQGWEACTKVYAAWLEGEAAHQIREREAEDERQREFVNEFARKLK